MTVLLLAGLLALLVACMFAALVIAQLRVRAAHAHCDAVVAQGCLVRARAELERAEQRVAAFQEDAGIWREIAEGWQAAALAASQELLGPEHVERVTEALTAAQLREIAARSRGP